MTKKVIIKHKAHGGYHVRSIHYRFGILGRAGCFGLDLASVPPATDALKACHLQKEKSPLFSGLFVDQVFLLQML